MQKTKQSFLNNLMDWHKANPRPMPWKKDRDPYKIWLSEIILQQTRVAQGTPYFLSFVKAFPTVSHLAKAKEDQVLKQWEGLGYYSRARNLHKAAQIIHNQYKDKFPKNYDDILALPGIGPYTAAAISSFAYEEPKAVVDGNVYRVISRYFGIDTPIDEKEGRESIKAITQEIIEQTKPSKYNQAIMNFGAMHCKSKKPLCENCPLSKECIALKKGIVDQLPIKIKKIAKRTRYFHFFQIFDDSNTLIQKRDSKDIWQGLFQFPMIETLDSGELDFRRINHLMNGLANQYMQFKVSEEFRHVLTHQLIKARFYPIIVNQFEEKSSQSYLKVSLKSLSNYTFPKLLHIYLNEKKIPLFKL